MYSVLGNHKTMTHQYTVNVIHVYRGLIVFTQQNHRMTYKKIVQYGIDAKSIIEVHYSLQ